MKQMIIVGGGQAGFSIIENLKALGCRHNLILFTEEGTVPYQRPPLSKKFLLGEFPEERLYYKPYQFYKSQNVQLEVSSKVTWIDRAEKKIVLENEEAYDYDKLFLAMGARARHLPIDINANLLRVYTLRNIKDVEKIRPEFVSGRKLVIIGGGYIGLETAAIARKIGLEVTIIESADRILNRVSCEFTSDYFRKLHRENDVKIIEKAQIEKFVDSDGVFVGTRLKNGRLVKGDFAIVGIGSSPNDNIATDAGIKTFNGIEVDEKCVTSDPDILAAGDCTNFLHNGKRLRLESVGNAIDQAKIAAKTAMGMQACYIAKPWFWSDQYDTKLQMAGHNWGYDEIVHRESEKGTSHWYFQGNKLISVDALNDPASYMIGKRLIEQGLSPDIGLVANKTYDLKKLLKNL